MVMMKLNQDGATQPLVIPMVIVVIMLVIMTGLSIWSYTQYTDQRDNVNARIDDAVAEAKAELTKELTADFEEREKSPYTTYEGSATLGSIKIEYPKTWSAYVEEKESGNVGIEAYFHPRFVPDLKSDTAYALRLELADDTFDDEVSDFQKRIENGDATSKPVTVSGENGVRIDGEYERDTEGSIVLLPVRDKTLRLFTESTDFTADFNRALGSLSFIP